MPSFIRRALLSIALVLTFETLAASTASADEYVIISGGPALLKWENYRQTADRHDRWWGNFVRSARLRIEQIRREQGPNQPITWLVYKPGYDRRSSEDGRSLIELIRSVRDKYNLRLVWIYSGSDLVEYINSGQNRSITKIKGLEYFGHSNKFCWLLDYSNYILGASKAWFHEDDAKYIKNGVFTREPFIKSWGCHTAESMSERWRYYTKTQMWGARGKTDYSEIWKGRLPFISTHGGGWSR